MATSPQIGDVVLNKASVRDSLAHGGADRFKRAAFLVVKDVIEKGTLVHSLADSEKNSHYISAPVMMDGRRQIVTVLVRSHPQSQRMYLHSVTAQENLRTPRVSGAGNQLASSTDAEGVWNILHEALSVNPETVSKIVDENGEPRVVFHGTASDFDTFDRNAAKLYWDDEHGFFFETSETFAKDYADAAEVMLYQSGRNRNAKGRIISAFLDIKNPAEEDFTGEYDSPAEWIDEHFNGRYADDLKSRGHDGAVFTSNGETVVVAFEPNQIKSATGNSGEFSRVNPSTLGSSPSPESAAVQEALAKMRPLFRKVFEDIEAGDSPAVVMKRYDITENGLTNILNQVRSRLATATAAAGGNLKPAMKDGLIDGGRPDLALSTNPTVAAVDQIRNESDIPDVRGRLHAQTCVSPLAQFLFHPLGCFFHVLSQGRGFGRCERDGLLFRHRCLYPLNRGNALSGDLRRIANRLAGVKLLHHVPVGGEELLG
jgi:hypothetical protein